MEFHNFKLNFSGQLMEEELIEIKEDTSFRQLSSWDSLTAMAVLAMIEDEYSVKITDQEFRNCNTVEEIFVLVKSKSKTG